MLLKELALKKGIATFHKKKEGININTVHGLFYINSGKIKLINEQKKAIIIDIYHKGEFFGYFKNTCVHTNYHMKLIFLEDTELTFLADKTIQNQSIIDNNLRINFISTINKISNNINTRLLILYMLKKEQIVLHMIYYLADKFGEVLNDGRILINIRLTESDLNEFCNTTRELVSRTLSKLINKGILDRENGYLTISSKDKLNDLILYNYFLPE